MLALFDLRNAPMGAKAQIFSDPLFFRTWPLIRAFDKVKSQVRAVQPRVSEIILYWVCDRFYQMFTKCGTHVRCILATFLSNFCHCGSNLGYIFRYNLSLWVHLPPSGEVLGGRGPNGSLNPWFWGPRGLPLGSLSHENSSPFLMQKTVEFVADFCMHSESENGSKWVPKWS